MKETELIFLSLSEQSKLLRDRKISAVELTLDYIKRIETLNPQLNAYITVTAESALESARKAQFDIDNGDYKGPLHGIPFAVKDQICTKGIKTTNSSTVLGDYVPDFDATVITKLKTAGAILLGKLNLSEFASGGRFKYPYGRPRNPWNPDYEPGSSSSGSGIATAASMCSTSIGEDTSGSIRHPSSWCGVVGLRPTWGRVSRHGLFGVIWSMDQAGPIARTVTDCALTLQPIVGFDKKDPNSSRTSVPDYHKSLSGNIKGVRVGVVKELMDDQMVESEVKLATHKAIDKLEDLGAEIHEVRIPLAPMARIIFYAHMYVEMPALYRDWINNHLEEFDYDAQVKFHTGRLVSAQHYYKTQRMRSQLRSQVLDVLNCCDVLVSPTMRISAPLIKSFQMPRNKLDAIHTLVKGPDQTPIVPLTGVPAITLPCGFASAGKGSMPIGLQVIGRPFCEAAILNVAYTYEQNTLWHERSPDI